MDRKLLLIVIDGVPWRNWRRLFGNLEGWVASGEARVWRHRSVLPSTSASCYASMHTGVTPQRHGCTGNGNVFRMSQPDVFSEVRRGDGVTGAVAHSFWSSLFNRHPFEPVRDVEFDEPDNPAINHGRFHTMTGDSKANQMTPCDLDLFACLTRLCECQCLNYGVLHSCTLDSLGHRFLPDSAEMDHGCHVMDEMLAPFIPRWREMGYEVIVTADHGQDERSHHGGAGEEQQDAALYYFGAGVGPPDGAIVEQLQLAPAILARLGLPVPASMTAAPFLN